MFCKSITICTPCQMQSNRNLSVAFGIDILSRLRIFLGFSEHIIMLSYNIVQAITWRFYIYQLDTNSCICDVYENAKACSCMQLVCYKMVKLAFAAGKRCIPLWPLDFGFFFSLLCVKWTVHLCSD